MLSVCSLCFLSVFSLRVFSPCVFLSGFSFCVFSLPVEFAIFAYVETWAGLGGRGGDDDVSFTCTHVTCYALDVSCTCTHVTCHASDGEGWVGWGVFLLKAVQYSEESNIYLC